MAWPQTDGASDVTTHAFFTSTAIDWQALYAESLPPPRKPELASPHDTSHFDEPTVGRCTHTLT